MGTCRLVFDPAGLHFDPPGLYCEHPRASRALFQPLKLLNFVFNADTGPVYKNNADPDPQGPYPCSFRPVQSGRNDPFKEKSVSGYLFAVVQIRIRRIHMFLGLRDPDPDSLVRDTDTDPNSDPSIIKQN
jgi:hypothetical protein